MYNCLKISRYIVGKYNEKNIKIDNRKLQNLLYLVQKEFLVQKHEPCFFESIRAWNIGAVVPEVYQFYEASYSTSNLWENGEKIEVENEDIIIIDKVLNLYYLVDSDVLAERVKKELPWLEANAKGFNSIVSLESMIRCEK